MLGGQGPNMLGCPHGDYVYLQKEVGREIRKKNKNKKSLSRRFSVHNIVHSQVNLLLFMNVYTISYFKIYFILQGPALLYRREHKPQRRQQLREKTVFTPSSPI
jgi:hypothetical protein